MVPKGSKNVDTQRQRLHHAPSSGVVVAVDMIFEEILNDSKKSKDATWSELGLLYENAIHLIG